MDTFRIRAAFILSAAALRLEWPALTLLVSSKTGENQSRVYNMCWLPHDNLVSQRYRHNFFFAKEYINNKTPGSLLRFRQSQSSRFRILNSA